MFVIFGIGGLDIMEKDIFVKVFCGVDRILFFFILNFIVNMVGGMIFIKF